MNLSQANRCFLDYLKTEKNFSERTLLTYHYALDNFYEYFKEIFVENPNVCEIEIDDIRPFLGWLQDKGFARNSIRLKSSALKSFFKFLFKKEYIDNNPAKSLSTPKRKKNLPNFLTEKEISNLLLNFDGNGFESIRNKFLIQMIYGSGLRISEALNLKIGDIDTVNKTVKVLGKGNKERIVPMGTNTIALYEKYIKSKNKCVNSSKFVFVSGTGNKMSYSSAYKIIHREIKKISDVKQKSPHTLRHTFATHLINNGADIRSVSEMLGHSSLSSTQIYTHLSIDKLKDIYFKAHPKAEK